jgi:hypothetical protein
MMAWGRRISPTVAAVACVALLASPEALAVGPPQIGSSWVTDVTATGANLRAQLNANGLSTKYRFEYISQAAYEANLAAVPPREGFAGAAKAPPGIEAAIGAGTTPIPVVQHIGGLAPVTAYRYRPVATNAAGTTVGPEHSIATQETSLTFGLPDDRGWEMVSPIAKGGGAIAAPEALFGGGDFQAAAAGSAVTYGSATAFGGAAGAPPSSQYLSRRTGVGWTMDPVSTPLDSGAYGDEPDGAPYRVFADDLSSALLFGGLPCRGGLPGCPAPNPVLPGSGAPPGYAAYYLRDNASGDFTSLLSAADVAWSSVEPEALELAFAAASRDLSHVLLSSCAALTADAVEGLAGPGICDPGAPNLYEWSASGLEAVNMLPGDSMTTPGAEAAASLGAISQNGTRVYWTQGGGLYLRENGQTIQVDESVGGGGVFQIAAADGSVAFFTKAGHLHRFLAATQAVADLTPVGGVVGVLGASANGGYVYYQDAAGLKRWHEGATATIAAVPGAAQSSDYPPATGTSRVSADGLHLAFLSKADLTGYDNADATTGEPDSQAYVYGPPPGGGTATLTCASCNPTGERPQGSSTIPGAPANGTAHPYKPRVLSSDGNRLFFDSVDTQAVGDTNSRPDVYEWEAAGVGGCTRAPGCLSLISSGRDPDGAGFVDASADGTDVFFLTNESLVGADPGSIDLYDARVGGGFAEAAKPIACVGDACQSLPGEPDDPTPGTLVPNAGNPAPYFVKESTRKRSRGRHRHRKRQHGRHDRGGRRGG